MKRSKIFLSIAIILMTCSAVYATKGAKKVVPAFFYKKGTVCVFVNASIPCSPSPILDCFFLDPATTVAYPCYENVSCTSPLARD